ncbi:ATPAse AAA+ type core protein [Neofusicoccum parvum]|nr:ATPAse AAA+ type core protein [Neofusicoccum parvum]
MEVMIDPVRGKGKGVIILLHGEPGVGKTSTAECIADYTSRPLFPITCGNIGQNAEDVEESLEKIFQLAHSWGCVLLLDEADVFLQERSKDDLVRNAVVSVFLRVLEYYSGILFLTTNRVGIMDQAFRSPIHLSLYYPALGKRASLKIWKLHLKMAKNQFKTSHKKLEFDRDEILDFAKEQYQRLKGEETSQRWNGRQIRNAFQTAIALAEYQAQEKRHSKKIKLTRKQFDIVQKTSDTFDEYLRTTQKGSQAVLARQAKTRVDDFKGKGHGVKDNHRKRSGRRKTPDEVKAESESSSFSESSESEMSSSYGDTSSDDDARKHNEARQAFHSSDDSESGVEEEGKGKSEKRKSKKEEVESDREIQKAKEKKESSKKKHRSKHKEEVSSDEDSEPEAKTGKRRSKK